jgi:hypothetical protein
MKYFLDAEYMKNHLLGYITMQLKQGYELRDIRDALVRYGYDKTVIENITKHINPRDYPVKKHAGEKELDEELFIYLQDLLVDYIKKEMSQGYTLEVIEKALINFGHHPDMVRKAVKGVEEGHIEDLDAASTWKLPLGFWFFCSVIAVIASMFVMAYLTGEELGIVMLAFTPALAAVCVAYAIVLSTDNKQVQQLTPVIAIAVAVGAFLGLVQLVTSMRNMGSPNIVLIMNVFIAFICSMLMSLFSKKRRRAVTVQEIEKETEAALQPIR